MAHEYGWAKQEIFEGVYFDELFYLIEQARVRKINDWKMQLAIISNPHVKDPKLLYRMLDHEARRQHNPETAVFDANAFDRLKQRVSEGGRIIVK